MKRRRKITLANLVPDLISVAVYFTFGVMVFVAAVQVLRYVLDLINGTEWIAGIVVVGALWVWDIRRTSR
jgi:hypothetical protein